MKIIYLPDLEVCSARLVDFTHSSGERKDYRLNFHAYSLSSFLNIPDYAPSSYSNSLAELNYDKYFGDHVFTSSVYYGFNTNKYYGFKPDRLSSG